MQSMHGVDGEAVVVAEIAQAIQREISRDVVDTCLRIVPNDNKGTWNHTYVLNISYDEHKRTLIDELIARSNAIYAKTFRGSGNVIVLGQNFANVVQTLPGFVSDSKQAVERPNGKIGVLNNTWSVLKDVYMNTSKALVAYKGDTFLDTGVVYSPSRFADAFKAEARRDVA